MDKKDEERRIFNMAKQDISFLKHLELVRHDDRPDFVLKDKYGRKIGLEHFRADVYRVQDVNSSHVRGGHTILNNIKANLFEKYHPFVISNTWTDKTTKHAANEFCECIKSSLDMQSHYEYEAFLDNLRVGIHGKSTKVKGHIQKSRNYPERESYDLMGFLIEIPVPSFEYYFETITSQSISQFKSLLPRYPLNIQGLGNIPRRFNEAYSYQKINGLPITNEIWKELNIFDDIDFVIIETYNSTSLKEHYGQYFDKTTSKPQIYPAFSFGFTEIISTEVQVEHKDGNINAMFNLHTKRSKYDVTITNTTLKKERRKQNRKTRKHYDEATKKFRER